MASVKGRNSCIVKLTRLSNLCCSVASAHWSSQGSRSANKPGSKPSSAAVDPSRISVLLYVSMGCLVLMADRNLLLAQDELAARLGNAMDPRSKERRVGNVWVSTCRYRWCQSH